MSIYYIADCDEQLPDHICDPCEDFEGGGVRSFALIKNSFSFVDPSDPTEWSAGIDSGDIIVIPQTKGSYDGGSETEGTGYGDQQSRVTGMNHQIQLQDPNYASNADFYNTVRGSRAWKGAYRTETKVHLINRTLSLIPKNPVQEDLTTDVVWDITIKWSDKASPVPYDVPPGIFDACVAVA